MCIACIEYLKGELTSSEYQKNVNELKDQVPHDPEAAGKYLSETLGTLSEDD